MVRSFLIVLASATLLMAAPACNHNKIPCPTYADSFPDKKGKKTKPGAQKPEMPKATKAKSSVMPGGKPSHEHQ